MIGPNSQVRVYLAGGATDMRKGFDGLAAAAQERLRQAPCSGAVFVFVYLANGISGRPWTR